MKKEKIIGFLVRLKFYLYLFLLLIILVIFSILLSGRSRRGLSGYDYLLFIPPESKLVYSVASLDGLDQTVEWLDSVATQTDLASSWGLLSRLYEIPLASTIVASGEGFNLVVGRVASSPAMSFGKLKTQNNLSQQQDLIDFEVFSGKDFFLATRDDFFILASDKKVLEKSLKSYQLPSRNRNIDLVNLTKDLVGRYDVWFHFKSFPEIGITNVELDQPVSLGFSQRGATLELEVVHSNKDNKAEEIELFLPDYNDSYIAGSNWQTDQLALRYFVDDSRLNGFGPDNFDLSGFLSGFSREYQIFFNTEKWLGVMRLDGGQEDESIRKLESTWRSYVAGDFPVEKEVVLSDGTVAVHYVRDKEAVQFIRESFLERDIYYLSTKDGAETLSMLVADDYLLVANDIGLIKDVLANRQNIETDRWLKFLPKKSGKYIRQWRVSEENLNQYLKYRQLLGEFSFFSVVSSAKGGLIYTKLGFSK